MMIQNFKFLLRVVMLGVLGFGFVSSDSFANNGASNGNYNANNLQLEYATFPWNYLIEAWEDDVEVVNVIEGAVSTGFLTNKFYTELQNGHLSLLTKTGFRAELEKTSSGNYIVEVTGLSISATNCVDNGTKGKNSFTFTDKISGISLEVSPLGILLTDPGERFKISIRDDEVEFTSGDKLDASVYKSKHSYVSFRPEIDDEVVLVLNTFNINADSQACGLDVKDVKLNIFTANGLRQANLLQPGDIKVGKIKAEKVSIAFPFYIDDIIIGVLGEQTPELDKRKSGPLSFMLSDMNTKILSINVAASQSLHNSAPHLTIENSTMNSMSLTGDAKILRWDGTSVATPMMLSGTVDTMFLTCSNVVVENFQKGEVLNTITYPCYPNE